MAREMVGQVAVQLEQKAEEAVTYFALGERARRCCLVVYPALLLISISLLGFESLTYRRATNVRNSISCSILGRIA